VTAAWERFGETGAGMPERGLESLAREVTGLELEDFFERYVRGTIDIPLQGLFKTVGIRMCMRQSSGGADSGGKPATDDSALPTWLGANLERQGAASRFTVVHSASPAELAGISPGDEAVAFDGLRLTAENIDKRLRDYHVGDRVSLTVFRDHRLMRLKVKLTEPPEDTCYLVADDDADDTSSRERELWLGASDNA
jgi:predicted metalloprotease with PDZ domain